MTTEDFRLDGLLLGVATAATQIEGGDVASNWVDWAARPGAFDEASFAHYRAELQLLGDKGIRPLLTLHHFNSPRWFEQRGGWLAGDAVTVFLRFVDQVVTSLGDLVDEFVTINEPNVFVTGAYVFGDFPPGHRSLREAMRAYATLGEAHVRAYTLIHERRPGLDTRVGVAHHLRPFRPGNPRNPWHRARYLHDHLAVVSELRAGGVPVERYYHWCFVDNWEWTDGEVPRFGLVALDYETQQRTVRPSGRFFADIAREGGVTRQMYAEYVAGQEYPISSEKGHPR